SGGMHHRLQPLYHASQLVAGDQFDVDAVLLDEAARLLGEGSGGHHENTGRTFGRGNAADLAHHFHADPLHSPVLALHEIPVLADARHQVDTAIGLMSPALLHAKTLAPEKLADQILKLAP